MGSTGKSAHIQPDFRQNHLGAATGDAGNIAKSGNRRFIFIHVILNQLVQVGNTSIQIVDMIYDLRQQLSLQRCGDSLNSRHKLSQFGAHPPVDHLGYFLLTGWDIIFNDLFQQLSGALSVDVFNHRVQFDVGTLQNLL